MQSSEHLTNVPITAFQLLSVLLSSTVPQGQRLDSSLQRYSEWLIVLANNLTIHECLYLEIFRIYLGYIASMEFSKTFWSFQRI